MTDRVVVAWTLVLCGAVLPAGGLSHAEAAPRSETRPATQAQPTAEQTAKIKEIVKRLVPRDPKSEQAVEDALADLPKTYLPALKKVLSAQKDPVRRGVLDTAAVRLEWGVDPRKAVGEWIDKNVKKTPAARLGRQKRLADEALLRALPDIRFTSMLLRQWPVAQKPPAPLKNNNLFIISKGGYVQHYTDIRVFLQVYLRNMGGQPALKTDQAKQQAARAWLCLSQELRTDGMFTFKVHIGEVSINKTDGTSRVIGEATVEPKGGDKGYIKATLTFNPKGRLIKLREQKKLTPGVRPICQSTKLLDRDPIVRKMAETEILLMGRRCEPYIRRQREKASPELRAAIDRIWRRVLVEEAEWHR